MSSGNINLININSIIMGLVQKIENSYNDDLYMITLFIFDLDEAKKLAYYNDTKFEKFNMQPTKNLIQLLVEKKDCKKHKVKIGSIITITKEHSEYLYVKILSKI